MKKQSRFMSLAESGANLAIGLGVSWFVQRWIFQHPDLFRTGDASDYALLVTLFFTGISFVRTFSVRRIFETIRTRTVHDL